VPERFPSRVGPRTLDPCHCRGQNRGAVEPPLVADHATSRVLSGVACQALHYMCPLMCCGMPCCEILILTYSLTLSRATGCRVGQLPSWMIHRRYGILQRSAGIIIGVAYWWFTPSMSFIIRVDGSRLCQQLVINISSLLVGAP